MVKHFQVAVVGAGPAGCAAAIQLKRSDISVALFEKGSVGGLALNANLIENYLGYPRGISGFHFVRLLRKQLTVLDISIVHQQVETVVFLQQSDRFELRTPTATYTCSYLILATGTMPKTLSLSGEKQLFDAGLLHYDLSSFLDRSLAGKTVAIVGGGDAAFDYSLNLSSKGSAVRLFHRSSSFRCLPLLYRRVQGNKHITIETEKTIALLGRNKRKAKLTFTDSSSVEVDLVFVTIGRKANDCLQKQLANKELPDRLFCIGDLVNDRYRQISIAMGDGTRVAMQIAEQLAPFPSND